MNGATLDHYGDAIGWVAERKDFNTFWPIGYSAAATAMGTRLIERLESALQARPHAAPVENPTAVLIIYLLSSFAIRDAGWRRDRRVAFAQEMLAIVASSKLNDPINTDGCHLLRWAEPVRRDFAWVEPSPDYLRAFNVLAGVSWACSEALYFFNHRIGTERHGPYSSPVAGRSVVIRTVFDVAPRELWPEVTRWPGLPSRLDLGFDLDVQPSATRFDMFANPLSEYDVGRVARRVAVRAVDAEGAVRHGADLATLNAWTDGLRSILADVLDIVEQLAPDGLALRVHQIMLYGARTVMGLDAADDVGAAVQAGRLVEGTPEEITRWLDLRQEIT